MVVLLVIKSLNTVVLEAQIQYGKIEQICGMEIVPQIIISFLLLVQEALIQYGKIEQICGMEIVPQIIILLRQLVQELLQHIINILIVEYGVKVVVNIIGLDGDAIMNVHLVIGNHLVNVEKIIVILDILNMFGKYVLKMVVLMVMENQQLELVLEVLMIIIEICYVQQDMKGKDYIVTK
jgi:hypothetical protein